MSKRRETRAFKEGVKAGVKPLKEKFDEISKAQGEAREISKKIRREQEKSKKLTGELIEEVRRADERAEDFQTRLTEEEKKQKNMQRQIDDVKLYITGNNPICEGCGKALTGKQIICGNCGKFVDTLPYDLKAFNTEYKQIEELKELASVIKNSKKDPTWIYPEMEDKFYKMKKIQNIAIEGKRQKGKNTKHYDSILNKTQEFFKKYNSEKIEIALVGTVKAGKSSLINALIGAEVASVKATPETSILTKYRTTKNENYLKIKYYTQSEWNKLWNTVKDTNHFVDEYNATGAENVKYEYLDKKGETIRCSRKELSDTIMEWTRSDMPKHFFIKEIEVGYESDSDMFPHDIYLVDTPGLNDPVKYRSEITKKYIAKADWVIACTVVESLSDIDTFKTLTSIRSHKNNDVEKIFIVANKKDQLSERDVKEKINEFLKRLKEEYKKNNWNEELAVSRFSVISAECHKSIKYFQRGKELEKEQRKVLQKVLIELDIDIEAGLLEKENVDRVINYSGVENLFNKMNMCAIRRKREDILYEIERSYYETMKIINAIAGDDMQKISAEIKQYASDSATTEQEINDLKEKNKQLMFIQKAIERLKENLELAISEDSMNAEV